MWSEEDQKYEKLSKEFDQFRLRTYIEHRQMSRRPYWKRNSWSMVRAKRQVCHFQMILWTAQNKSVATSFRSFHSLRHTLCLNLVHFPILLPHFNKWTRISAFDCKNDHKSVNTYSIQRIVRTLQSFWKWLVLAKCWSKYRPIRLDLIEKWTNTCHIRAECSLERRKMPSTKCTS